MLITILIVLLLVFWLLTRAGEPSYSYYFNSQAQCVTYLAKTGGLKDIQGREFIVFKNASDREDNELNEPGRLAIQLDTLQVYELVATNPPKWIRSPIHDPQI